jgi:protein TonB
VFDEVTKREDGKNAARRAGYVVGSTAFQIALVFGIIALSATIKAQVSDEPVVDVKFVRPTAPPPPPPPPAPPARKPPSEKPKSDVPKPPPPPPQALLQPKDVQEEMKAPDPNEPPEPEYDYSGSGEGVVGGVVGASNQIEEAPSYAGAGYVKPRMAQPGCVQNAVRIPRELQGYISGPITVKFAVKPDGAVTQFAVQTQGVPDRIVASIWQAVQGCQFIPGTDPRGKPTSIWVILPLRFTN